MEEDSDEDLLEDAMEKFTIADEPAQGYGSL